VVVLIKHAVLIRTNSIAVIVTRIFAVSDAKISGVASVRDDDIVYYINPRAGYSFLATYAGNEG
jgi:hypothetical protein